MRNSFTVAYYNCIKHPAGVQTGTCGPNFAPMSTAQTTRPGAIYVNTTPTDRPVIMPTVPPTARPGATKVSDTADDSDAQSFAGEQPTGNLLWLWGVGALVIGWQLFKPKTRRRR